MLIIDRRRLLCDRVCLASAAGRRGSALHPVPEILTNPEMLYIAIGIIGATVMPHNLYLHSSIVQTRDFRPHADEGRRHAIPLGR